MKKIVFFLLIFCFTSFFTFAQTPLNDDCNAAIVVPVSSTTTCTQFAQGDLSNATLSTNPFFSNFVDKDIWFKFTATSKLHKINISDFGSIQGNNESMFIQIVDAGSGVCNHNFYIGSSIATDTTGFVFDFNVGEEYIIRVSTFVNFPTGIPLGSFKICITTPISPTNISCDKAKKLNIPTNGTPLLVSENLVNVPYSFMPQSPCTGTNPEKPLWYSFKATQNAYSIQIKKAISQNQGVPMTNFLRIYEGDSCFSQKLIYCKINDAFDNGPYLSYQADKFVIGKNYFVVISSAYSSPMAFDMSITAVPNSPVNDVCDKAIPLTINTFGSCTTATNGATGNFSPSESLCPKSNELIGDIWYSFIATKKSHIISLTNKSPDDNLHFSLLTGSCNALYQTNTCYETQKTEVKNLIVGEKYFVVVSNNDYVPNFQNHTFTLCVQDGTPPPPNDDLQNAITLEVNPTLSPVKYKSGNLAVATGSGLSTCSGGNGNTNDIFYTFTATNKQHLLQFSNINFDQNSFSSLEMAVLDDAFTNVFCNSNVIKDSTLFLEKLTVGKKYTLRIYSYAIYTFDIAVTTPPLPPVNDLCSTAISLTPSNDWSCKNPISGTNYWATQDDEVSFFRGYGVWYSFTATATKHNVYLENIVGINSNNLNIALIVSKNPCDLDSLVYTNRLPNNPISILSGLEIGKKYYINVQSDDLKSFVFFDICITTPTGIFSNENCQNATNLVVNPTEKIIDFLPTSSNYYQYLAGLPKNLAESQLQNVPVWYKFTATSKQHIINFIDKEAILGNTGAEMEINFYEESCNNLVLSKVLSHIYSNNNEYFSIATNVGKTYLIQVSAASFNSRLKFNLAVCTGLAPLNDDCSGAFDVKVTPATKPIYSKTFNYRFATDSLDNYPSADLWYTFTAQQPNHTLQLTSKNLGIQKPYIKIYKGSCNSLVFFKEFDLMNDTMAIVNGLQSGEKYFVRLFNRDEANILYQFAIGTPPFILTNDDYSGAISLVSSTNCSNPIVLNTTWATVSPQQGCVNGRDVWYKFTAQKTQYLLALEKYENVTYKFFTKNANGNLEQTPEFCYNFIDLNEKSAWIQNLIIGKEYWIAVVCSDKVDVKFCLLEPQTPPVNDEPNNAIAVAVNPDYSCTNKAVGTANWATPSDNMLSFNCQNFVRGDVWYKFVATKIKHYIKISYPAPKIDTTLSLSLYQYDATTSKYIEQTCPNKNEIFNFDFEKNKEYFIKISDNQYFTQKINFNLCINTQIGLEPPANDECDNATLLSVKNAGIVDSTIYTTYLATAQNTSSICGFDKRDLWYKFVATDTIHKFAIDLSPKYTTPSQSEFLSFSFYKSDVCPDFGATECHYPNEIIGGFEIGKTYYIRLLGNQISSQEPFYYNFTIQKVNIIRPSNDICNGAKNIPINTSIEIKTYLQESNLFAQKSPNTDSICNKKIKYHDVWYKFTATKANHNLQIFDKDGSAYQFFNAQLFADVYKGNCNTTFTSIDCTSEGTNFENIALKNLNIGETYYVRVYANQDLGYTFLNYRIAVSENNNISSDCNNAVSLVSKQIYENTMFTTPKKVSWADFNNFSVASQNWYKFTAKSQAIVFNLIAVKSSTPINNLKIALLKSPCADSGMVALEVIPSQINYEQIIKDLEKDSTYYIVFYDSEKENLSYQFYIEQATPPVVNNVCQGAIAVPMNPTLSPISILKDSLDTRFNNISENRYYKFVPTSSQHYIYLKTTKKKPSGTDAFINIIFTDCDNQKLDVQIKYSDVPDYYQISELIPNTLYYLMIPSLGFENDKKYYELAILTQNNIASNDLCANSISLDAATTTSTKCSTSIPVVLKNATADEVLSPNLPYQWYHFTAKTKNQVLKIRNYKETNAPIGTNFVLNLHTYNDCNNYVISKSLSFDFIAADSLDFLLDNLTVGQKYKLTMAKGGLYSVVNFDICIGSTPPAPSNDLCKDAILLTPSPTLTVNSLVSGTVKNALIEQMPSTCHPFDSRSVWYKFKAIAEKQIITFKKPANYDLFFDVFKGKCDSLEHLGCHFDSLTLWSNLKVGNEYFIAVGTNITDTLQNLNFKIAVTTPLGINTNVDCPTATNLPISATDKVQQYVNGDFLFQNELWYKFTATAKSHRIHFVSLTPEIKNESANYTPVSAIIGFGNGCNDFSDTLITKNLTTYFFKNLLDSTSNNNIISGLVIGKTYYLGFGESAGLAVGTNIPFKIGLSTVAVPNNQTNFSAQILPINAGKTLVNFYSENTKNLRTTSNISNQFEVSAVLWYEFTATAKRHQLLLENLQTDPGYYITAYYNVESLKDPFNPTNIFTGYFPNYSTEKDIMDNLSIGQKYYIPITLKKVKIQPDGSDISQINMTYRIGLITYEDRPHNDDCENADIVPINTTPNCQQVIKGTTLFATNLNQWSQQNGNDDNVWYKFTAIADRNFIQLKNIKPILGTVIDMEYAVYADNNNDCQSLTLIGRSSEKQYPLSPWKLEVGRTYFIEVYTRYYKNYSRCEFDLCVSTPIANDDFKGAILLSNVTNSGENTGFKSVFSCTNALTASSLGATYSFDAGIPIGACKIGTLPKDIWFKTVVGTKRNLAIQVLQSPTGADVQVVAYKVKNNVLTVIPSRCPADSLFNLTQGDTIALRVWDAKDLAFGDYTLCIERFEKTTDTKNLVCTNVKIHPVPTSDYLNFNVDYIEDATYKVNVISVSTGQVVINQTTQKSSGMSSIDVRSLPSGNYVLKVFDTKKLFVKQFIKI